MRISDWSSDVCSSDLRSIAAARYLFAVASGMEIRMTSAPSPRRWLFVLHILVGSFLLFLVQPMVARMVLPKLGGAPAVWNSAMLVYQALLLGGYAYEHWLGRSTVRRQALLHVGLFLASALWLTIGIH